MRRMDFGKVLLVFCALMLTQAGGAYLQAQRYKKAVRRMRKLGNVGIGSRKAGFTSGSISGNIVVIACDGAGRITGGEIMEGVTVFSGFKAIDGIAGKTIDELRGEYSALPEKRRKYYRAHVQALDALDSRLGKNAV